jgi:hypothetical protein
MIWVGCLVKIYSMAINAKSGSASVSIDMALVTVYGSVSTGEWEVGGIVVKIGRFPGCL